MEYSIHTTGDVIILTICGSLDRDSSAPIHAWFENQITSVPTCVVINLKEVSYMDSIGLATLVAGLNRARELNGDIWLCCLPHSIRILFELTRMDKIFECYPTEEAAVQTFTCMLLDTKVAKP